MFDPRWLKAIVPLGVILAIFFAGWTVNGWRVGKKNVKLQSRITEYETSEKLHIQKVLECQMNRTAMEEALDKVVEGVNTIAAKKDRMQGALDAASIRTIEIAEARAALEQLEIEHAAFLNRTADMTTCQTYEEVLVAIAGGSHEQ